MTPPPLVSVVVPTHGTRALTLECLASVCGGAGRFDVVVVDDGSRDGTSPAVAACFPEVRLLRNETAQGFSAAANLGLRAARGEILWLLNSDAVAPRDAYGKLCAAFDADPRLGVAGAELTFPDGRPQWSGGAKPTPLWLFAMASGLPALVHRWRRRTVPAAGGWPRRVEWVTGAALALRRAVWEALGPLDEGFRFYAQDLDLCIRAGRAGFGVSLVPGLRVRHHLGASIGRGAHAWDGADPERLWSDLVRCLGRLDGPRAARQAAAALRAGARLRLLGREAAAHWQPAAERAAWQRGTAVYRRALEALERTRL